MCVERPERSGSRPLIGGLWPVRRPSELAIVVSSKRFAERGLRYGGMQTLVLWDLDYTLVDVGSVSREAFAEAFVSVTGQPLRHLAELAGRTDRAIITETLAMHDLAAPEPTLRAFGDALATAFAARDGLLRERGRVLPGARAALKRLAGYSGVVQSVLTGNVRPVAVGKLTALGLAELVDVEVGAYGLDDVDRPSLVRLARRRAHDKYGIAFDEHATVLIGDTPHDVDAGHRGGARVVAVATGGSSTEVLEVAGAEVVFGDLTDTDTVIRAVLGAACG